MASTGTQRVIKIKAQTQKTRTNTQTQEKEPEKGAESHDELVVEEDECLADLEAKVLKANTRRGMGPSCPQCFRKTTRGVCDPWSKHGDRAFYKCQPCDKFVQWAEPPKKEDVVEHIGQDDHLFFIPPTIACAEQPDENAPGNDSDIIDLTSP